MHPSNRLAFWGSVGPIDLKPAAMCSDMRVPSDSPGLINLHVPLSLYMNRKMMWVVCGVDQNLLACATLFLRVLLPLDSVSICNKHLLKLGVILTISIRDQISSVHSQQNLGSNA